MNETLILMVAFVALPIVLLFATAGCVGEDPEFVERARQEGHDAGVAEGIEKGVKAVGEEQLYNKSILQEPLLVGYWRLNEAQGQTTLNNSFGNHHGEYRFTAGIALAQKGVLALFEDPNDKSAQFLGTQGYADIPHSPLLNPPELTIECWVLPEGNDVGQQVFLGSYEIDATGTVTSGYMIEIVRTGSVGGVAETVKVRARLGGGGVLEADLGPGLQREGWRHVVLTYRRSTPSSAKLYVNADGGAPAAEKDDVPYIVLKNPQPLRLGAGQSAPGVAGLFFKGRLDEVAIYNGVLTNAQIQTHYLKSF